MKKQTSPNIEFQLHIAKQALKDLRRQLQYARDLTTTHELEGWVRGLGIDDIDMALALFANAVIHDDSITPEEFFVCLDDTHLLAKTPRLRLASARRKHIQRILQKVDQEL